MVKSQKSSSKLLIKIIVFIVCLAILIFLLFKFNIITGNYLLPAGYLGTAYAPPYNVFESNAKVFNINPEYFSLSGDSLTISANVSMPEGYIYQKGYVYNANTSDWEIFDFVETPVEGSYWIPDFASTSLIINSSSMLKNGENYIVAYACKKYDGEWKCGCNSQTDVCSKWMLQAFNLSETSNYVINTTVANCVNNSDCVVGNCVEGECIKPINWLYQGDATSLVKTNYYLYVNYTKPTGALNLSLWEVKHGQLSIQNLTIPSDCWNADTTNLMLAMYSRGSVLLKRYSNGAGDFGTASSALCYNGTNWNNLTYFVSADGGQCRSTWGTSDIAAHDGNWNTYSAANGGGSWAEFGSSCNGQELGNKWYESAMVWAIQ